MLVRAGSCLVVAAAHSIFYRSVLPAGTVHMCLRLRLPRRRFFTLARMGVRSRGHHRARRVAGGVVGIVVRLTNVLPTMTNVFSSNIRILILL